jgi:hypothetical protein
MVTNTDERLDAAVTTLNELIALMQSCDLHESAQFLAMAKLHLLMDLNDVSDKEFRALCVFLEREAKKVPPGARIKPARTRNRRDSELRGMRRAWQCPEDAASPRGGRRRAKQ